MPFTASHSFARDPSNHHHRQPLDESCTRTVMIVVNRKLALPSSSSTISTATATPGETPQTKTKAGSILRTTSLAPLYDEIKLIGWTSTNYLVNDDTALCLSAFDRGCLEYLAAPGLIQSIIPAEPASPEREEVEPKSISSLREVSKIKDKKQRSVDPPHLSLNRQFSPLLYLSHFSQTTSDEG